MSSMYNSCLVTNLLILASKVNTQHWSTETLKHFPVRFLKCICVVELGDVAGYQYYQSYYDTNVTNKCDHVKTLQSRHVDLLRYRTRCWTKQEIQESRSIFVVRWISRLINGQPEELVLTQDVLYENNNNVIIDWYVEMYGCFYRLVPWKSRWNSEEES